MKNQDKFIKTQVRIPENIYNEIRVLAETSDRSINGQIVHLFKTALNQSLPGSGKDELKQIIKKALREELKDA